MQIDCATCGELRAAQRRSLNHLSYIGFLVGFSILTFVVSFFTFGLATFIMLPILGLLALTYLLRVVLHDSITPLECAICGDTDTRAKSERRKRIARKAGEIVGRAMQRKTKRGVAQDANHRQEVRRVRARRLQKIRRHDGS